MSPRSGAARARRRSALGAGATLLLGLLAALLLAACETGTPVPIEERYTIASGQPVAASIVVEDGSVAVEQGDEGTAVLVTGQMIPDRYEYSGDVLGGEVRLAIHRRRTLLSMLDQRGASLKVVVPKGAHVNVTASNGPVSVKGAFTSNAIETSNGAVDLAGVTGDMRVETANAAVRVVGHVGALEVKDSNGEVVVIDHQAGIVRIETSNGRIEYRGSIEAGGANELETANAPIDVELTGQPSLMLDARTKNAAVNSRYALLDATKSTSTLVGRIASGEARLNLRTSNAPINVR